VFHGFIIDAPAELRAPVMIQVEEWLSEATPLPVETVAVPHFDEGEAAHIAQKDGIGLSQVWGKIEVSRNVPITVLMATERGLGVQPGEPFFLTSDAGEAGIIRSLMQQTRQWDTSPDLVFQAVESLSRNPNPSLASYLVDYLELSAIFNELRPDRGATLGLQILVSRSVPPYPSYGLNGVVDMVGRYYIRLPAMGRAEIVQGYTELIQQFTVQKQPADLAVALAAFRGLTRIASFDPSVEKPSDPATLSALSVAYIAGVKNGEVSRAERLVEAELGISPSAFPPQKRTRKN
jgi:hypothetical protein